MEAQNAGSLEAYVIKFSGRPIALCNGRFFLTDPPPAFIIQDIQVNAESADRTWLDKIPESLQSSFGQAVVDAAAGYFGVPPEAVQVVQSIAAQTSKPFPQEEDGAYHSPNGYTFCTAVLVGSDRQEGTSKNSRYRSRATRLSSNDSGLFSFRFVDVHSRTVRDWQRNQFFEVPKMKSSIRLQIIRSHF
jgi:hypothetical protein